MEILTWNDSLSIGSELIDDQHKSLIALVNEAAQAVANNTGREQTGVLLNRLCNYAVEHFASEEALMDPDAYPEYDMHMAQHMDGTEKALDFLNAYSAGKDVDLKGFVEFLAQWVHTHIMEVDQTLGAYLKAAGKAV